MFRLLLIPLTFLAAFAQDLPPDRVAGLETPWLQEKGWRALLDGNGLKEWHTRDGKPGAWFTTRAVSVDPAVDPKKLLASPQPGARYREWSRRQNGRPRHQREVRRR